MIELSLDKITVVRDGQTLVNDISVTLQPGKLTVLVGPNGAGKTTLLKCAAGILMPTSGTVKLNQQLLTSSSPIERARSIAYLPQSPALAWPLKVRDSVALGRYAYGGSLQTPTGEDKRKIDLAISACGLEELQHRNADSLSGGEHARMHCARLFASDAPLILADEPVSALDLKHQYQIMQMIRHYVSETKGALIILHDLNLVARFSDRVICMQNGSIVADGTPKETLTPALISNVFEIDSKIINL